MTARMRRFTGTVTVDVSGYVTPDGSLTTDGYIEMWSGLAGAQGLPVRLIIGQLVHPPLTMDAFEHAGHCESIEVCGADPHGVAAVVKVLRHRFEVVP